MIVEELQPGVVRYRPARRDRVLSAVAGYFERVKGRGQAARRADATRHRASERAGGGESVGRAGQQPAGNGRAGKARKQVRGRGNA